MNFAMLELALAQDLQDKARKEINETLTRHDGKMTYEALMEMEYLHQVFSGSLRSKAQKHFNMNSCFNRITAKAYAGFHAHEEGKRGLHVSQLKPDDRERNDGQRLSLLFPHGSTIFSES